MNSERWLCAKLILGAAEFRFLNRHDDLKPRICVVAFTGIFSCEWRHYVNHATPLWGKDLRRVAINVGLRVVATNLHLATGRVGNFRRTVFYGCRLAQAEAA